MDFYVYILAPCNIWECYNGGDCIENRELAPHYAECECPEEYEGDHCELSNVEIIIISTDI